MVTSSYCPPTQPLAYCCTWDFPFTHSTPTLRIIHTRNLAPIFSTWMSPSCQDNSHISTRQTKEKSSPFFLRYVCLSCALHCSPLQPQGPGLSPVSLPHYNGQSKSSRVSANGDTNNCVKNHKRPQVILQFFNRCAKLENSEPGQVVFQRRWAFSVWAFISTTRLGGLRGLRQDQRHHNRVQNSKGVGSRILRWRAGWGRRAACEMGETKRWEIRWIWRVTT